MTPQLSMSFFDGTMNREQAKQIITERGENASIFYTLGLKYRHPVINMVPVSQIEAIKIINEGGLLNFTVYEDYIDINEFSSNDLW